MQQQILSLLVRCVRVLLGYRLAPLCLTSAAAAAAAVAAAAVPIAELALLEDYPTFEDLKAATTGLVPCPVFSCHAPSRVVERGARARPLAVGCTGVIIGPRESVVAETFFSSCSPRFCCCRYTPTAAGVAPVKEDVVWTMQAGKPDSCRTACLFVRDAAADPESAGQVCACVAGIPSCPLCLTSAAAAAAAVAAAAVPIAELALLEDYTTFEDLKAATTGLVPCPVFSCHAPSRVVERGARARPLAVGCTGVIIGPRESVVAETSFPLVVPGSAAAGTHQQRLAWLLSRRMWYGQCRQVSLTAAAQLACLFGMQQQILSLLVRCVRVLLGYRLAPCV